MQRRRDQRGLSLVEVLVAAVILAVGLLGIMAAFPTGYIDVVQGGGQSKAASYARQQLEVLKNQPFPTTLPTTGNVTLPADETAFSGTYSINLVPGTTAPNQLVRIIVSVTYSGAGGGRPQTITLETMRAQ